MSERGDVIDRANDLAERVRNFGEARVREAAANIEAGNEGECDLCGEWSARLVHGVCAPCRDRYRLP